VTWILILTLFGATTQSGRAIASVPGFGSEQVCKLAGEQWVRIGSAAGTADRMFALCVRSK